MELEAYGPIDRLFEILPPPPTPPLRPLFEQAPESTGFQIKGWHIAVAFGVLGIAGFVIWKVRHANRKTES